MHIPWWDSSCSHNIYLFVAKCKFNHCMVAKCKSDRMVLCKMQKSAMQIRPLPCPHCFSSSDIEVSTTSLHLSKQPNFAKFENFMHFMAKICTSWHISQWKLQKSAMRIRPLPVCVVFHHQILSPAPSFIYIQKEHNFGKEGARIEPSPKKKTCCCRLLL